MAKVNYINIENVYPLTYAALYDQASEYRRKKADKYNKQEDALMCILSEAMLRYALKQSGLNVLLTPKKDGNGKPYIEGENFKFNVSYAGKFVAIAYSEPKSVSTLTKYLWIAVESWSPNTTIPKRSMKKYSRTE